MGLEAQLSHRRHAEAGRAPDVERPAAAGASAQCESEPAPERLHVQRLSGAVVVVTERSGGLGAPVGAIDVDRLWLGKSRRHDSRPAIHAAQQPIGRLLERHPEFLAAAHRAAFGAYERGGGHYPKYSLSVATASWPASRSSISVQAMRRPISIDWSMLL